MAFGRSGLLCALYIDTDRKLLHLVSRGRSGGRADLDRAGGGGMEASWDSFVTLPNTQTNKKSLSPKRGIIIYPR